MLSTTQANKQFSYPRKWIVLDYVGIVFFLGLTCSGAYWLFTDPLIDSGWEAVFITTVGSIGAILFVFEKNNRATIIVNDKEIVALKAKRVVQIAWSDIDHVYYSTFQGRYADRPMFSLYMFSKKNAFIKITQNIDNYFDLMELIVRHCPRGHAEPISFWKLLQELYRTRSSQ